MKLPKTGRWIESVRQLHQREFDILALALPRGHGFGDRPPIGAWLSDDGFCCGIATKDVNDTSFGIIVMRRRVDSVWTVTVKEHGFRSRAETCAYMEPCLKDGSPREALPREFEHDRRYTILKRGRQMKSLSY